MVKRGTKRLPDTIKIDRGTIRTDRTGSPQSKPQPNVSSKLPEFPEVLKELGKRAWSEVGEKILRLGVATELDWGAFETYCRSFDEVAWCDQVLETQGHFFTSETGFVGQHPAINQRFKWLDVRRRYEAEFGLTPSSRSGVTVGKSGKAGLSSRRQA